MYCNVHFEAVLSFDDFTYKLATGGFLCFDYCLDCCCKCRSLDLRGGSRTNTRHVTLLCLAELLPDPDCRITIQGIDLLGVFHAVTCTILLFLFSQEYRNNQCGKANYEVFVYFEDFEMAREQFERLKGFLSDHVCSSSGEAGDLDWKNAKLESLLKKTDSNKKVAISSVRKSTASSKKDSPTLMSDCASLHCELKRRSNACSSSSKTERDQDEQDEVSITPNYEVSNTFFKSAMFREKGSGGFVVFRIFPQL